MDVVKDYVVGLMVGVVMVFVGYFFDIVKVNYMKLKFCIIFVIKSMFYWGLEKWKFIGLIVVVFVC